MAAAVLPLFASPAGTAAAATAAGTAVGPVTAAASGAGALGGATGASLFSALPTLSLSTGFSLISGAGSILGGFQQAGAYKAQAQQSELAARAEELKGREQADKIRRSLQATLASQNAAFAARGVSIGSGTPVNISNVSRTEAAADIEAAQFGSTMSAGSLRSQGGIYRQYGSAAKIGGFTSAFGPVRRSLYA